MPGCLGEELTSSEVTLDSQGLHILALASNEVFLCPVSDFSAMTAPKSTFLHFAQLSVLSSDNPKCKILFYFSVNNELKSVVKKLTEEFITHSQ